MPEIAAYLTPGLSVTLEFHRELANGERKLLGSRVRQVRSSTSPPERGRSRALGAATFPGFLTWSARPTATAAGDIPKSIGPAHSGLSGSYR